MHYLSDIFDLAQSVRFDEGAFQVYQTLGRLIVANAGGSEVFNGSTAELANDLQTALNDFNPSWQLCSGLSMEVLWNAFRPSVAENVQQLEARLEVEELADRFDALRWASDASFEEILILRQSVADMYNKVKPADAQFNEQLEVSKRSLTACKTRLLVLGRTKGYPQSRKPKY